MAISIAYMTSEDQQACVGMWGDIDSEPAPVVIRGIEVGMVSWVDARHPNRNGFVGVDAITPRFDLPRAWNPDGTPVEMAAEVEYRIVPADSNGGIYQTRRWIRHVTEWRPDATP